MAAIGIRTWLGWNARCALLGSMQMQQASPFARIARRGSTCMMMATIGGCIPSSCCALFALLESHPTSPASKRARTATWAASPQMWAAPSALRAKRGLQSGSAPRPAQAAILGLGPVQMARAASDAPGAPIRLPGPACRAPQVGWPSLNGPMIAPIARRGATRRTVRSVSLARLGALVWPRPVSAASAQGGGQPPLRARHVRSAPRGSMRRPAVRAVSLVMGASTRPPRSPISARAVGLDFTPPTEATVAPHVARANIPTKRRPSA